MVARQVRRSVVMSNLRVGLLAMDSDRLPLRKRKDVLHGAVRAAPLRQSVKQPWDWVFVLRKDVQEAINDVYSGSAERLFRFYASATEDINVSASYTDKSGATKTIILQGGLPVYLEASRFQLGLSRLGQQGPDVTVRGNFGPCW